MVVHFVGTLYRLLISQVTDCENDDYGNNNYYCDDHNSVSLLSAQNGEDLFVPNQGLSIQFTVRSTPVSLPMDTMYCSKSSLAFAVACANRL